MTATAMWFGPPDRPLFGWMHQPADGRARAGMVLCSPLGYEGAAAHRTFRVLAERLADAGIAALRFDYDGTGDSAGDDTDPSRVPAWLASVSLGVDELRRTGVERIGLVGMRIGALLAAEVAAQDESIDALVLWDPVWSGKAYLRQLQTLHLLTDEAPPDETGDGSIWSTGTQFTSETVASLRGRRLADLSGRSLPTLYLRRPDVTPVGERQQQLPPDARVVDAISQERLLECPSSAAVVPEASLALVVDWVSRTFPDGAVTLRPPAGRDTASVGGRVVERTVHLGPIGLFGIVAGPEDAATPTIVLLNGGTDHHAGPNRMWVEWGRSMAKRGYRVARVDLSGLGDSPHREGQLPDCSYAPEASEDVAAIVAGLDTGNGVILGGLCSGARHAIACATTPGVRGVLAMNPALHLAPELLHQISNLDPNPAAIRAVDEYHRVRSHVARRLPRTFWRTVHRSGLSPSRAQLLADAVDHGVDVFLAYGADDFFYLRLRETSAWHIARLARRPGFHLALVPGLDHALMQPAARQVLLDTMTAHIVATFGSGDVPATPEPVPHLSS